MPLPLGEVAARSADGEGKRTGERPSQSPSVTAPPEGEPRAAIAAAPQTTYPQKPSHRTETLYKQAGKRAEGCPEGAMALARGSATLNAPSGCFFRVFLVNTRNTPAGGTWQRRQAVSSKCSIFFTFFLSTEAVECGKKSCGVFPGKIRPRRAVENRGILPTVPVEKKPLRL